jgi:hypothetical protein
MTGMTGTTGTGPSPGSTSRLGGLQAAAIAALLLAPIALAVTLSQPSGVCACSPTAPPRVSPVEGIIRSVDSAGLGDVRGFVLLTTDGDSLEFTLGPLDDPTAFPPGHLAEHQASSAPVRVYFRRDDAGTYVVYRLEDAAAATAT